MKLTRPRFATLLAFFLTLAVLLALLALYRPMYPIDRGTSDEFWQCTVGLAPHGPVGGISGAGLIENGYAYYAPVTMDSTWTHRVPADEAMKDFPLVLEKFEQKAADPSASDAPTVGYRHWKSLPPSRQDGIRGLSLAIEDARVVQLLQDPTRSPGVGAWFHQMRDELRKQITRAHYYWANFVFEFLFLGGFIWFILWPAIRTLPLYRWLLHLALAPFVFLLPAWLGYCCVLAGGVGPAGGILYPYLLLPTHFADLGHNPAWELAFLRALPKLFEPLNQTAWDLNVALDPSLDGFFRFSGPIQAALASLILCALLLAAKLLALYVQYFRRRHTPRGFDVLMNKP